jgi:hypothetical protein
VLGIDPLSVDDDVEDPARPLLQLGLDPEALLDLGRETRGPALIASSGAVGDLDGHGSSERES